MADTNYVVLRKDGAGAWVEVGGIFVASSTRAALRLAAEDWADEEDATELVAVPARSWVPMRVAWASTPNLCITRQPAAPASAASFGGRTSG